MEATEERVEEIIRERNYADYKCFLFLINTGSKLTKKEQKEKELLINERHTANNELMEILANN